ncbi:hypothetical protein BDY21DRAFT_403157 [Lineolata rhizophorae]|uniref:Uncharacterized protein n=1 Tax=Lineolata rhizophorae TaxID=578093 RepID=A0A6A6PAL2_9PEZI|nr:hypothetical protein BDY21DRAFT_403157 [Lineolata rhizophorae]
MYVGIILACRLSAVKGNFARTRNDSNGTDPPGIPIPPLRPSDPGSREQISTGAYEASTPAASSRHAGTTTPALTARVWLRTALHLDSSTTVCGSAPTVAAPASRRRFSLTTGVTRILKGAHGAVADGNYVLVPGGRSRRMETLSVDSSSRRCDAAAGTTALEIPLSFENDESDPATWEETRGRPWPSW